MLNRQKNLLVVVMILMGLVLNGLVVFSWGGNRAAAQAETGQGTQGAYSGTVTMGTVAKNPNENTQMVEAFGEVTKSFFTALGYGFVEATTGITFENAGDGKQIVKMNQEGNLLAYTDKAFTVVSSLPISGLGQAEQTLEVIGLSPIQKVDAQGYGFASLEPLLTAWRIFRNIAYVFFTVIILAVGIMILFQQKFDGSLVLTVQKAIPNIILSLILVTFSYAIVGFMIDIMYLIMFLFGGLFAGTDGLDVNGLITNNIFGLGGSMLGGSIKSVWQIWAKLSWGNVVAGWGESEGFWANVGGFLKWLIMDVIILGIIGAAISLLLMIIVIVVVLINIWKLFILLLKSYVLIILNTIFAPIMLMLGAIPGNQGIKKWFNAIIGNLSAFVTVFVIMVIYYFIRSMANVSDGEGATTLFVPPYLIDMGVENPTGVVFAVLGLGLIIILPELVEKVRKKMGAEKGFLGEMADAALANLKGSAAGAGGTIGGKVTGAVTGTAGAFGEGMVKGVQDYKSEIRAGGTKENARKQFLGALGGAMKPSNLSDRIKTSGDRMADKVRNVASRGPSGLMPEIPKTLNDVFKKILSAAERHNSPDAIAFVNKYGGVEGYKQWVSDYQSGKVMPGTTSGDTFLSGTEKLVLQQSVKLF